MNDVSDTRKARPTAEPGSTVYRNRFALFCDRSSIGAQSLWSISRLIEAQVVRPITFGLQLWA